jgi:hypothetical protein
MPANEFYHFRFRDPRTGRWMRAGYLAQVPVIRRCYAEWQIIGRPEIKQAPDDMGFNQFNPFRTSR